MPIIEGEITTPEWWRIEAAKKFTRRNTCSCGYEGIHSLPINGYPHDGGYKIEEFGPRYWMYVTCPECDYSWSLLKLVAPEQRKIHQ